MSSTNYIGSTRYSIPTTKIYETLIIVDNINLQNGMASQIAKVKVELLRTMRSICQDERTKPHGRTTSKTGHIKHKMNCKRLAEKTGQLSYRCVWPQIF